MKSTVHRVVAPREVALAAAAAAADGAGEGEAVRKERYSIAYFCHPLNDTALVPVPSEAVKSRLASRAFDARGKESMDPAPKIMTAAEHLQSRLAATYGWREKEG